MTVAIQKRNKPAREYYVYYDDWTGEVISVGHRVQPTQNAPHFVTSDAIAQRIVSGQDGDQDYLVHHLDNQTQLISKSANLRLRQQEDALFLLPTNKVTDWNVRVRLYTKNMLLVVEINHATISRLVAINRRNQIQVTADRKFKFYITKKDAPEHLITTIIIEPDQLICDGQSIHSVIDITKHVGVYDLDVFTRRIFENYHFEIIDDSYVDVSAQRSLPVSTVSWQVVGTDGQSHIRFTQHGNCVMVNSIVSAKQLDAIGIHTQMITFYVVGATPDAYLGNITVDMARLRVGQIQKFNVDFDIYNGIIMYRHPKLKVSKNGK
jgi:hypothetical protein